MLVYHTTNVIKSKMSAGYTLCEIVILPATLLLNITITNCLTGGNFLFYGLNWIEWNR